MSESHSTIMVRVPGSPGDSGFHRESLGEDVRIKTEPGIEASAKERSSRTCEDEGSPDQQSFGRGFDDKKTNEEIDHSIWKINLDPLLSSLRGPPQISLFRAICWMKVQRQKPNHMPSSIRHQMSTRRKRPRIHTDWRDRRYKL